MRYQYANTLVMIYYNQVFRAFFPIRFEIILRIIFYYELSICIHYPIDFQLLVKNFE